MPGYLLKLSSQEYPELESLVSGQRVRLSIHADVVSNSGGLVILKTSNIVLAYKQKFSVYETVKNNLDSRLASIEEKVASIENKQPSFNMTP